MTTAQRLIIISFLIGRFHLAAFGATPGLPFTEDFTSTDLRDATRTNANWSTLEGALLLNTRGPLYGAYGPGLVGTDFAIFEQDTRSLALGDMDGDGDLDIVEGISNDFCRLHYNGGINPSKTAAAGFAITDDIRDTRSIAIGDLDRDGDLDVAAGNYGTTNRLYLNDGTNTPFSGMTGFDIAGDTDATVSVALGDLDGDGDLDLVAGNEGTPNRLYLNNGTSNPFDGVTGSDITSDASHTSSVALGDLDSDGDLDLVVVNFQQRGQIFLNNGTDDPFAGVTAVEFGSTVADIEPTVALGDMDGDGNLDIVTVGGDLASFDQLYLNNGTDDPFAGVIGVALNSDLDLSFSIAIGDIDCDGDLDVLTGNTGLFTQGGKNRLYLNNGSSQPFLGVEGINFTEDLQHTVALALGDLDGDGDLDAIAGNRNQVNRMYLNPASPNPYNGVAGIDINPATRATYSIVFGDVDRDGDPDMITGNNQSSTGNQPNRLHLNQGPPNYLAGVNGVEITNDMDITQEVLLGDIDDDGDLDLIAANFVQRSKLYLNNGTSDPFAGAMGQVITGPEARNTTSAALGDMNGDGRLDVLIGIARRENQLFLNNGSTTPFQGVTPFGLVVEGASNTFSVAVGDVDRDGDLDIVDGIVQSAKQLLLNNGTSNPFLGVVGSAVGPSLFEEVSYEVAFGDMDGDGDLDLVTADQSLSLPYSHPSHVYFNNGTPNPFDGVAQSPISSEFTRATALTIGDVDLDGDLDVIVANFGERDRLYLNNGTSNPFADGGGFDVSTDETYEFSVVLEDIDSDGHLDFISGSASSDPSRFFLNAGTPDPFIRAVGENIALDADFTQSLAAGDIDRDGDVDLVAGNFGQRNKLYLNNGTRQPFKDVVGSDIGSEEDSTSSMALGDIDRDGDLDLVVGNFGQPNRLYLNNGTSDPFEGASGVDIGEEARDTLAVALGDLNRDANLDLVVGNFGQPTQVYLGDGTANPFGNSLGIDVSIDAFATRGVALGDVNRDGKPDILTGNQNQPNRLYLNNGTDNPFNGVSGTDITADANNTISMALADVNRDGAVDLVAGNANQFTRLYLNNKIGAPFNGVAGRNIGSATHDTSSVALADMDKDGDLDLIAGVRNAPDRLYLNNGTLDPFSGAAGEDIASVSDDTLAVVPSDFNGDGGMDIAMGNRFQPNRFYVKQDLFKTRGVAASLEIDNQTAAIGSIVLSVTDTTPPNTSIDYWVSNDNGVKWRLIEPNAPFSFPTPGSELRWRADLKSLSAAFGPTIDAITLTAAKDSDVSASTLSFGQRDINSGPSTPKILTVTNVGFEDLNFLEPKAAITGMNASQFAFSPQPELSILAPGESVEIGIVFDPSDLGPVFATLEITTEDSANPLRSVPLSGTGVNLPTATFTPTPTSTATSTLTPTPSHTPTQTPSALLNYDIQPDPADGFVDARDLIEWLARIKEDDLPASAPKPLLFDLSLHWGRGD